MPASKSPAQTATTKTEAKRPPGRPRTTEPPPVLEKKGIVETPTDANNRLEMVYDKPAVFKSLFTYFKNLKTTELRLRCNPTGVTFFTRDGSARCRVVAHIPGKNMNHFYCDSEFWMGLDRAGCERIFSSIDKSFFKITFLSHHDDLDNFIIMFKDHTIEKDCIYKIAVSTFDDDAKLLDAEKLTDPSHMDLAPVSFTLSSRQFKKTVTDSFHHSSEITFRKIGKHPLEICHSQVGRIYREVYRSPDKISLKSDLEEDEHFQCTVNVADLKSLASSMVTTNVQVFCYEDNDIVLKSDIEALNMMTFVPISV